MYRVSYLLDDYFLTKEFKTFDDAAVFAIKLPFDSVLEIKQYGPETYNFQNESNCPGDGC